MKSKKTVLIITDPRGESNANAIRAMLSTQKDLLAIIIGKGEFRGIVARVAKDRLVSEGGTIFTQWEKVKEKLYERRSDDKKKWDLAYNSKNYAHRKMVNAITRYTPDVIIVNADSMLECVLVGRKQARPDAKVVVVPAEFSINKQYLSEEVDLYIVHNEAMKVEFETHGIVSEKIAIAGLPTDPKGQKEHKASEAIYIEKGVVEASKKTVLFLAATNDAQGIEYALEEAMPAKNDYNYLVYCGRDRKLLQYCKENGITAYNEGSDYYELVNIADYVVTRPIASNLIASFAQKNVIYMLAAVGKVEERYAANVAETVINVSKSTDLIARLSTPPEQEEVEELMATRVEMFEEAPPELLTHTIIKMI